MQFVDTHAHIYGDQFNNDREVMLKRTFSAGVTKIFMPNVDSTSIEGMLALEDQYPDHCFSMMGVHPCSIEADFERELKIAEDWLAKRKFVAIGEIGLDYYWSMEFVEQQKEALKIQVGWAKKYDLPIVIHCRDSFRDTVAVLAETGITGLKGIFHCFSGSIEDAQIAIDMGFKLGIGGVSTFKNGGLDKVIPFVELKHLVLETDSPYLAPVPYRGKRNETSYIPLIAQRVADLKGISVATVAEVTTQNALSLFGVKA
ncbi:TatD family hydrolase [Cytophagaceae bacterium DM2B3-1]|uniref:TatD family hydrolase n=1 Tax=Xanthocytophaga flava TaxID=3048013 RepID=A0ABT7CE98_9BACT|nr:TatD family hydrolase [Xanthocytophaga flavus]MDJ1491300.1 TatD family hydrolase [Xanthocytophaga flavus]